MDGVFTAMKRRLVLLLLTVLSWHQYAVALTCCRGEYLDNGVCKLCPPNTYQELLGAESVASCKPCANVPFPDGSKRNFSWAGNGAMYWCNAGCGLNQYWTYPCITCADCSCAAPPPVGCSREVDLAGGCVLDPVAEACFERAICSPSPCPFVNTSTGRRTIQFKTRSNDIGETTTIRFPCSTSITLQVLAVAGGGGGGGAGPGSTGGGGGAGGVAFGSLTFAANTIYTVTVGGGGVGDSNGQNTVITRSSFGTVVVVIGGGHGADAYTFQNVPVAASAGGSGGGGGGGGSGALAYAVGGGSNPGSSSIPSVFTFRGSPGGEAFRSVCSAAGGGGAGGAGDSTSSALGGGGGQGYMWPVTGERFAGGGGGASCIGNSPGGVGGAGGGGNGGSFNSIFVAATPGVSGTGGGGGGALGPSPPFRAGATGGSGVVILSLT